MYMRRLEESRARIKALKVSLNQKVTKEEMGYYSEHLNMMDIPKLNLTKVVFMIKEVDTDSLNFCTVAEMMELQLMIAKYLKQEGFETLYKAYLSNPKDAVDFDVTKAFEVVRKIYMTGLSNDPAIVMGSLFDAIKSSVVGICKSNRMPVQYDCDTDGDVIEIQVKDMVSDLVNLLLTAQ